MRQALLAFALLPVRGFVVVSPSPIQRHRCENARRTLSSLTRRRERLVRPPTALSLANAEAGLLSAGTAGALDRVPLEMGIFGLFCLLNIFELALVPTTFLNLGLIEVVEDFVERQSRAEDTPYAIDAPQ